MHDGLWDAVYEECCAAGGAADGRVDFIRIAKDDEEVSATAPAVVVGGTACEYDRVEAGGVDLGDDGYVKEGGWRLRGLFGRYPEEMRRFHIF